MDSKPRFPNLLAQIQGTREDALVLGFVDLCGTKAHVAEFIKNNGGGQHALTLLQTSFSSALANVANECSELQVVQASDGAFLIGTADNVLTGIIKTFIYAPSFFFRPDKRSIIPMRAAIASGLIRTERNEEELSKLTNLFTLPFWGEAFTKVYLMEQSKTRAGIQIFATQKVLDKMSNENRKVFNASAPVSSVDIYGQGAEPYYYANWLALVPEIIETVLSEQGLADPSREDGIKNLALIVKRAQEWANGNDKYYKIYGQSILDLRDTLAFHLEE